MEDGLGEFKGLVKLWLYGPDNELKYYRENRNLITTLGFDAIANMLGQETGQPIGFQHIGIGTGSTAPASSNTTLGQEIGQRQLASYLHSAGTKTYTLTGTFAAGNAIGTITEAGLFNNNIGGTMFARQTFTGISKGAADSLQVQWTVTYS